MEEHSQILGLISINGINSEYVKYTYDQIIDLLKYAESQSDINNIIIHGYGNIGGDEKVIIFPKNSVISYMKC